MGFPETQILRRHDEGRSGIRYPVITKDNTIRDTPIRTIIRANNVSFCGRRNAAFCSFFLIDVFSIGPWGYSTTDTLTERVANMCYRAQLTKT
jgi:hypothetical protein